MLINNRNYELEFILALLTVEASIVNMSNNALLDLRRECALLRYEIRNNIKISLTVDLKSL